MNHHELSGEVLRIVQVRSGAIHWFAADTLMASVGFTGCGAPAFLCLFCELVFLWDLL